MRLNGYIDQRLERWAAWKQGTGVSIAPWARLRYGTPPEVKDPPPRDEERETEQLVHLLHPEERRFIEVLYPIGARSLYEVSRKADCRISTVYNTLARLHAEIARMIDQRRRGEGIDPKRRPLRSKALRTNFASVVP